MKLSKILLFACCVVIIGFTVSKTLAKPTARAVKSAVLEVHEPYQSQFGQDLFVHQIFFPKKKDGVFIDIGAHDGKSYSNTYFFESQLGWSGLCVEPMPETFKQLEACRPKSVCVNGCVSSEEGPAKFLKIHGKEDMLSGLVSKYDERHLDRVDKAVKRSKGSKETLTVQCYQLSKLCEENQISSVDFMSIDTEGGELEILKSIDFDKTPIDVITVENNYASGEIGDFLRTKGYRLVTRLGVDEIYKFCGFF